MSLLDVATLAKDPDFVAKVDSAVYQTALDVLAEDDVFQPDGLTPLLASVKRKGLANSVLKASAPAFYLPVAASQPTTDQEISSAVEDVWNRVAGVTTADGDSLASAESAVSENQAAAQEIS